MTSIEAEKIIEKFHQAIKDLRPNAVAQSSKELPYTSARIKYAHFVYGEGLIKNFSLSEENLQWIMESYGIIDAFFIEDPEPINVKYKEYLERLHSISKCNTFDLPGFRGGPVI